MTRFTPLSSQLLHCCPPSGTVAIKATAGALPGARREGAGALFCRSQGVVGAESLGSKRSTLHTLRNHPKRQQHPKTSHIPKRSESITQPLKAPCHQCFRSLCPQVRFAACPSSWMSRRTMRGERLEERSKRAKTHRIPTLPQIFWVPARHSKLGIGTSFSGSTRALFVRLPFRSRSPTCARQCTEGAR